MKLTPTQKHLFSRFNLRGEHVTWVIKPEGWIRINKYILRWRLFVGVKKV